MKFRANTVDLAIAMFRSATQLVVFIPAHRWWARGDGASAFILPTMVTIFLAQSFATAARARGRSRWWGALAILGPVGLALIFRRPLRPVPVVTGLSEPPPASPFILGAVAVAQAIIVIHCVATYPWDKPLQWVGESSCYLAISSSMMPSLSRTLMDRGYPAAWAAFGLLGPIGLIVVFSLPDRTVQPARGFAVQPPGRG